MEVEDETMEPCSIFHKPDDEFHNGCDIWSSYGNACGFIILFMACKMGYRIPADQYRDLSDWIRAC